jgi:DNA-binding MarR family transcriptional regulator
MAIDPLRDYPGYALRRASAATMQRLAGGLQALDLRASEASILVVIEANPGITQSEIGRLLDIAGANMAPLMRGLHERGLVERNPVDGRSHALQLTASGRTLNTKVRKVLRFHEDELLQKIPPADRATFLRILHAIYTDASD